MLAESGDDASAIAEYRIAVRLRPGVAGFHSNLALALYRSGKLQDAETEAHYCASPLSPAMRAEELITCLVSSIATRTTSNLRLPALEAAINLNANYALRLILNLGLTLHNQAIRTNDQPLMQRAESECRRAVELSPDLPGVRILGWFLRSQRKLDEVNPNASDRMPP